MSVSVSVRECVCVSECECERVCVCVCACGEILHKLHLTEMLVFYQCSPLLQITC